MNFPLLSLLFFSKKYITLLIMDTLLKQGLFVKIYRDYWDLFIKMGIERSK